MYFLTILEARQSKIKAGRLGPGLSNSKMVPVLWREGVVSSHGRAAGEGEPAPTGPLLVALGSTSQLAFIIKFQPDF